MTSVLWLGQPSSKAVFTAIGFSYFFAKTMFVALLAVGAFRFTTPQLTGLKNRRALAAVLRAAYDTGATIVFFDLNDFKEINDSLGHQAGDEWRKRFADALRASFRPDDHVFRFAGDEFVVIAQGAQPSRSSIAWTSCGSDSGTNASAASRSSFRPGTPISRRTATARPR